ncbi:hypothetical protein ACNQR7_31120 [Mycolicibacterium senegalense]|uniref:hypothetical protein n=1 Tax=Mycobacteriaceae TaxID=1762 RepID=UPI003AAF5F2E
MDNQPTDNATRWVMREEQLLDQIDSLQRQLEAKSPQRHMMTVEQQQELAQFINRNSLEDGCGMPDHAIACYLAKCYQALCIAAESKVPDWERQTVAALSALTAGGQ